jgi:Transposase DDE domain.
MLAGFTDPRRPRGVRHALVAVLGVAVVATLAGASNYRELGSVAADFPQQLLERLGARFDSGKGCSVAPSAGTLRRVLIAIDADELDRRVGAWLREHADCDADGWAIALDGKDLNGSWDDQGRLVLFSAMTHSGDDQAAVVIGQIAVPEGTTETTQVKALLDRLDIAGALVSADAAHTCAETARYLVEDKNADYLLTVKGNRKTLHAAALAAARELIMARPTPEHVTTERGHGRISRWSTWTAPVQASIGLPHAATLAIIRRDVADLAGQPLRKEIALILTSRAALTAADISARTRGHWGIENLEHRPRDTVWHEDDHQAWTGNGPRAMATIRNLALGLFSIHSITKIKTDRASDRPEPPTRPPTTHIASQPEITQRL